MERFYVAETTGYLTPSTDGAASSRGPGVTAMVLDRLNLHRPAFLVRSEELRPPTGQGRQVLAREQATEACVALNAGQSIPSFTHSGNRHGTVSRYRYGRCRCAECRAAKATEQRRYQARRKRL